MNDTKQPECPECERLHAVSSESQKIGEFLEWLTGEKGLTLAEYHTHSDGCYDDDGDRMCGYSSGSLQPVHIPIEKLLAEHFKIDLDKVENERRALLEYLRGHEKDEVAT